MLRACLAACGGLRCAPRDPAPAASARRQPARAGRCAAADAVRAAAVASAAEDGERVPARPRQSRGAHGRGRRRPPAPSAAGLLRADADEAGGRGRRCCFRRSRRSRTAWR